MFTKSYTMKGERGLHALATKWPDPISVSMSPDAAKDRQDERDVARSIVLRGRATSKEAEALASAALEVSGVSHDRPTGRAAQQAAAEAFIGDLLRCARLGVWGRRSLDDKSFSGRAIGKRAFRAVMEGMKAADLVQEIPGYYDRSQGIARGRRTLFAASGRLLDMAAAYGVRPDNLRRHANAGAATKPDRADVVVLRAAKSETGARGEDLPIPDDDPRVDQIRAELEAINGYLAAPGQIEGFAFDGLRRIFAFGDQPGFSWRWGGRFYAMPGADDYMRWPGGKESRAAGMWLQGEEVGEVDISASHLTILYGLRGEMFDNTVDPYGPDREAVKTWLTAALGAGSTALHPSGRNKLVREKALTLHPILDGFDVYGLTWADLQFHEAEIIRDAMVALRERDDVAALPVHDSLIVPLSRLEVTRERLSDAFSGYMRRIVPDGPPIIPRIR